MDEASLLTKLQEAERRLSMPADRSLAAYRARLHDWRLREADIEYRCALPSPVSQIVFGAMCLRYGLAPYRRSRRTATVCVRAPRGFVHDVFWPEFEMVAHVVEQALCDTTRRVMERWAGVSLELLDKDETTSTID